MGFVEVFEELERIDSEKNFAEGVELYWHQMVRLHEDEEDVPNQVAALRRWDEAHRKVVELEQERDRVLLKGVHIAQGRPVMEVG